jgi:3-hydroxyacyl-CoA dehydrogenase
VVKEIRHIGIIGEGKMGSSIFLALNGFDFLLTWLCSSEAEKEKAQKIFNKKTKFLFQSGVITEAEFALKAETTKVTALIDDIKDCDLVIEAIWEDAGLKKAFFVSLDKVVNSDCIFTTNSSSILPSQLIPSESRRDKFAGLHFFFPVPLKNVVELIPCNSTSLKTIEALDKFLIKIKKKAFLQEESHAFILNRLFLDFQAEAYRIFLEGRLSYKEIDDLVKQYFFPIGVFEFFDHVGNDIMLSSISNYEAKLNDKEFYAPLLIKFKELVDSGRLGIKTKSGFYNYPPDVPVTDNDFPEQEVKDYKNNAIERLKNYYKQSVLSVIELKLCSFEELAEAIKDYMGMDTDPFAMIFS